MATGKLGKEGFRREFTRLMTEIIETRATMRRIWPPATEPLEPGRPAGAPDLTPAAWAEWHAAARRNDGAQAELIEIFEGHTE